MMIYKKELDNKISVVWENDKECDYQIVRVYNVIDGDKVLMIEERKESNVHFYSIDKMGFDDFIFEIESYKDEDLVEKEDTDALKEGNEHENTLIKRVGNKIYFGNYYINDNETLEPIEWDILEEKNGKALVISHYILDYQKYDYDSNNYEESYIREWLNDDFYNDAFSDEEMEIIRMTAVDNSVKSTGDPKNKCICNNTNDYIFLLSHNEVKTYYKSDDERQALCTKYVKEQGLYANADGYGQWWLRSAIDNMFYGMYGVGESGGIYLYSIDKFCRIGVRPACWIRLK